MKTRPEPTPGQLARTASARGIELLGRFHRTFEPTRRDRAAPRPGPGGARP